VRDNIGNNAAVGIIAHVDAGKTTLSEAMLYLSGETNKLGRVDSRDSHLDTHFLERSRGITIFSKQAALSLENNNVYLLDTPGHADFAAEAERTLQILDYAVLVISGTDGVQAHTETLWKLLKYYEIPCLVFVTKMDVSHFERQSLLAELRSHLSEACVDFSTGSPFEEEELAVLSEKAMEEYLENGCVSTKTAAEMLRERRMFPCFFGSGLKLEGVEELLKYLDLLIIPNEYEGRFNARVYKILRDAKGSRMTGLKITGGSLKVRDELSYTTAEGEKITEKVTQLRIYSGDKFETVQEVPAGAVCMALGLSATVPGMSIGVETGTEETVLEPVINYTVLFPNGEDPAAVLPKFMLLNEEDPALHVVWDARSRRICMQLMGKVQTEILRSIVKDRFDFDIEFDRGRIMYRETIADTVEGVGHFEPLRHYAEVHLIMEPLPTGSGLQFTSSCSEDAIDRNWQRLIMTHLYEKTHLGVLTGSPITDMRITLAAGRAHTKHTEGGDFRQATYRAIRQGLMQAQSVLLEPYYSFTIEVPDEFVGRAMTDIRMKGGEFNNPESLGGISKLTGYAPVAQLNDYQADIMAYTHGRGKLFCLPGGYRKCSDPETVIAQFAYSAESDTENSPDSVFCSHGAGTTIKWDKVFEYMHLDRCLKPAKKESEAKRPYRPMSIDEKELEAIMEREFGPIRRREYSVRQVNSAPVRLRHTTAKKEYVIVDGYNVVYADEELKKLAEDSLDLARTRLMDMLANYAGFRETELVLVFDAYRTPERSAVREEYNGIFVVYTGKSETADAYIEKLVDEIGKNYAVRVISADNLIRLSVLRSGVLRSSPGEFMTEVAEALKTIGSVVSGTNEGAHTTKLIYGKQ